MKEIALFSALSFVLILFGVLYFAGWVAIGPVEEPEQMRDEASLLGVQLAAIDAQKKSIGKKREEIRSYMNDLELERKLVAEERQKLELLLDRIEGYSMKMDEERQNRISKLAKLYESMKPEKAASIASSLDMKLLMDIVIRMKEKQAAKMMAALPPATAAEISRRLGKRGIK